MLNNFFFCPTFLWLYCLMILQKYFFKSFTVVMDGNFKILFSGYSMIRPWRADCVSCSKEQVLDVSVWERTNFSLLQLFFPVSFKSHPRSWSFACHSIWHWAVFAVFPDPYLEFWDPLHWHIQHCSFQNISKSQNVASRGVLLDFFCTPSVPHFF